MGIGQIVRRTEIAGGVAELDVGILGGHFDHVVLVSEAVGEDDVAAGLDELAHRGLALCALGDVVLVDDLVDP